jgi:hypothetical protein
MTQQLSEQECCQLTSHALAESAMVQMIKHSIGLACKLAKINGSEVSSSKMATSIEWSTSKQIVVK